MGGPLVFSRGLLRFPHVLGPTDGPHAARLSSFTARCMAAGTFGLGQSLRPKGVGPGVSTWKRRYRMIRLRCIRTSPDHYSVLLFLGDCKGEPMAAQRTAQRSSAVASTLTSSAPGPTGGNYLATLEGIAPETVVGRAVHGEIPSR